MTKLVLLGIMVAVMSIPAFAVDKDSAKGSFVRSVIVGSSTLPMGSYKVTWTGAGSEVQVNFAKGTKVIATALAKLIQSSNRDNYIYAQHGVQVCTVQKGSETVLLELDLAHVNLLFEDNAKANQ